MADNLIVTFIITLSIERVGFHGIIREYAGICQTIVPSRRLGASYQFLVREMMEAIPTEIMEILADDADEDVRFTIATKNRLPENLQLKLAKDPEWSVRYRVVYNKKATLGVLEILLNDDDEQIRELAKKKIDGGRYQ